MKNDSIQKLPEKFLRFIEAKELLRDTDRIIAAVSGGVDSMVMLSLLLKFQKRLNLDIIVVHFNHLYRGKLADADQQLVENFCKKQNIQCFVRKADVKKYAETNGVSFEMAGRELRYQFFYEIVGKHKNSKIATAHIASDNAETILLHIIKGCGLKGLKGIEPQRDAVIRPILFAKKDDLYRYAEKMNIPFSEDHTNFENDCERNIIRNEILPILKKKINPALEDSLEKLSEIAGNYHHYAEKKASEIYRKICIQENSGKILLKRKDFVRLEQLLRSEILLLAFKKLRSKGEYNPGYVKLEQLNQVLTESKTGKYLTPFPDLLVERNRSELIIVNTDRFQWKNSEIEPGKIYTMEFFIFSSKMIKFDDFSGVNNLRDIEYIDAKKIKGTLRLRHWQAGDRFKPLGSRFEKKLSDFFIDEKISGFQKKILPLLVDDEKILWICGYRINDDVKITNETKKILEVKYKEIENG
jgi:tRNA(Ile)-lysidine synthase